MAWGLQNLLHKVGARFAGLQDEARRHEIPVAASGVLVRLLLLPVPVFLLLLKIAPDSSAGVRRPGT
jgi:hypothetical protein